MPDTTVDNMGSQDLPDVPDLFRTWQFPHCPFEMECSAAVLERIRQEVEQACQSRGDMLETGGVLFGIHERERVRILAARPLECEHALGAGFVLSEKDERCLARLMRAPATVPELNGLAVLGWYHSHIRSGIFLSERDRQIHARYFDAPFQIALVIRRESKQPARAGFFFRESSGSMRTAASYQEFAIDPPAAPQIKPAVVSKPAPALKRTPSAKPPQPRESICPRCAGKNLRRSRRVGLIEQFCAVFGFYPYRCNECLSRSFLKTYTLLDCLQSGPHKRPEERKRVRQRTRREILLWGGGILGFMAILYYMVRDTGSGSDQP